MKKTEVQKPFEYEELLAMCLLCAGHGVLIATQGTYKDEKEGREMIEEKVVEIINLRWNAADKGTVG